MKNKLLLLPILFFLSLFIFSSCAERNKTEIQSVTVDTSLVAQNENASVGDAIKDTTAVENKNNQVAAANTALPEVLIYNFHVTNRCASCIAIEEGTTKTLNTYFSAEVKNGRIKRQILNVDDDANQKISEKYQAFGSGLYVTRVFKGKETTTDLTGDGFKYAKNKEEKFIEILKKTISNYLK